jgi:hypothetical protein
MLNIQAHVSFDDLMKLVTQLTKEQKLILLERLEKETLVYANTEVQMEGPRVPDLFPGIWTSDDFDDPLPDEFWFGEET